LRETRIRIPYPLRKFGHKGVKASHKRCQSDIIGASGIGESSAFGAVVAEFIREYRHSTYEFVDLGQYLPILGISI
jgi:hypothetical protein